MSISPLNGLNTNEAIRSISDPEIQGEDPDSSQEMWGQKELELPEDSYDSYSVIRYWLERKKCNKVTRYLENQAYRGKASIFRSFKHITLPEALMFIYVLTHSLEKGRYRALLRADMNSMTSQSMVFHLKIYKGLSKKLLHTITLTYHFRSLTVTLNEENKKVGRVRYVIRGKKCEEIEGVYKGKSLTLDPVWSPNRKDRLKQEYFRYGKFNANLIYNDNIKHGSIDEKAKHHHLKVRHKDLIKSHSKAVITKSLKIDDIRANVQLVFEKGILIPVFGVWKMHV
ncbi:hypothetical protein DID78_01770 [Candidatus Marinamargulisbacteria bacterium SCGC AG-343-D04]|nr:hypothetical protein DID78_01770 [Candidatus Marinamargulisbacteria bacterium SCGC AG-343-D04]